MDIPQKHFDRLVAWEMYSGVSYEEAFKIIENSPKGQIARVKDALDYTLTCVQEALRMLKRS